MIPELIASTAASSWNPLAPFGVTSWEPFVANLIAFIVMVVILRVVAFKPIQNMLEKRRQRIIEGEEMRAESEQQLADVQKTTKEMVAKAAKDGLRQIEEAKQAADRLIAEKEAEAGKLGRDIIEKSKEAAELEARQAKEELKGEFARLVAMATAGVTGKVLSEEDHAKINREVIDSIHS